MRKSAEEVAQSIVVSLLKPQDCQSLHTTAGFKSPLSEGLHPVSVTEAQGARRLLGEISSPGEPRAQLRESPSHTHTTQQQLHQDTNISLVPPILTGPFSLR